MSSCEHGTEKFSKNNSSQNFSYFVIYCILNTILRRKNNSIFKKTDFFYFLLPSIFLNSSRSTKSVTRNNLGYPIIL